jgi:NADH dehydrogenase FAD-containing subunit
MTAAGKTHVVVIGGGYAGTLAAARLALRAPGHVRVRLVNASDTFVERVRLHQVAAGRPVARHSIPELLTGTGVEFLRATVQGFDLGARRVRVACEGLDAELPYDLLVYALGSRGDVDGVPGAREHAIPVGDADAAARLRERLAGGGRVVVIGGGLTGIEAATEIAAGVASARVSLVTAGALDGNLAPRGRRHLKETFERMQTAVFEDARVVGVREGALEIAAGDRVPFDACVWAGSFRALPLAAAAGLEVNDRGQVKVDAALRSLSHPEVFAVGDAAAPVDAPGTRVRMDCASALPMGAHAADAIAALARRREPRPFRFAYLAKCISLGPRDGIVQHLRADGTPRRLVLTGRAAAFVKEAIVRYTVWALRHPLSYSWPGRAARGPASPADLLAPSRA